MSERADLAKKKLFGLAHKFLRNGVQMRGARAVWTAKNYFY